MILTRIPDILPGIVLMIAALMIANRYMKPKRNIWLVLGMSISASVVSLILPTDEDFINVFSVPANILLGYAPFLILFYRETWKRKLYVCGAFIVTMAVSVAVVGMVFSAAKGSPSLNMEVSLNLQSVGEVILAIGLFQLAMLPLAHKNTVDINLTSYSLFVISQGSLILANLHAINGRTSVRIQDYTSLCIGFFICIAADLFLYRTMVREIRSAKQQTEHEALRQLQNMQLRHSRELQEQLRRTSVLRHDIANHLCALDALLEQSTEQAQTYLRELIAAQPKKSDAVFCRNPVVNAVIYAKSCDAAEQHSALDVELNLPELLPLGDVELVSLFSNLLDNALDACTKLPEGMERKIVLSARTRSAHLLIRCENPCMIPPVFLDGIPQTTKEQESGTGTGAIRQTARDAGGDAMFVCKNGVFTASIAIPM